MRAPACIKSLFQCPLRRLQAGGEMESLERVVLNLTGCYEQTVNVYFYLLFVFTSGWRGLLTGPSIRW